jgi:hypothetical protein
VKGYTWLWLALRNATNVLAVATILFCFLTTTRWPATLMAMIIVFNALAVALAADSYIRYIDHTLPLSITLAGLTISAFRRVAWQVKVGLGTQLRSSRPWPANCGQN